MDRMDNPRSAISPSNTKEDESEAPLLSTLSPGVHVSDLETRHLLSQI